MLILQLVFARRFFKVETVLVQSLASWLNEIYSTGTTAKLKVLTISAKAT
jgi:hypothetical protein